MMICFVWWSWWVLNRTRTTTHNGRAWTILWFPYHVYVHDIPLIKSYAQDVSIYCGFPAPSWRQAACGVFQAGKHEQQSKVKHILDEQMKVGCQWWKPLRIHGLKMRDTIIYIFTYIIYVHIVHNSTLNIIYIYIYYIYIYILCISI